jgi:Phage integrase family
MIFSPDSPAQDVPTDHPRRFKNTWERSPAFRGHRTARLCARSRQPAWQVSSQSGDHGTAGLSSLPYRHGTVSGRLRREHPNHCGLAPLSNATLHICRGCRARHRGVRSDHRGGRPRPSHFVTAVAPGLRAGGIYALRLHDIDWQQATVRVSGKSRRLVKLPLPQEVGDAILHYLATARPAAKFDHLLLRHAARVGPFAENSTAVSAIVKSAIHRAGVYAPAHGAHLLRHSAATSLLAERRLEAVAIFAQQRKLQIDDMKSHLVMCLSVSNFSTDRSSSRRIKFVNCWSWPRYYLRLAH